jgi:hypothetical protein
MKDHRNSDGRCGRPDMHDGHWWGPQSVFYCDGTSEALLNQLDVKREKDEALRDAAHELAAGG